jgi:hypothetical protein
MEYTDNTIAIVNHNRHLIRLGATLTALLTFALATIAFGTASASASVSVDDIPGNTSSYFTMGTPGDNGSLTVSTYCDHWAHQGSIGLSFMTPNSEPGGLIVHTRIWVKRHTDRSWKRAVRLNNRRTFVKSVFVQSSYFTGDALINQPQEIVSGVTFRGASWHYYDVGFEYWIQRPGGTWSNVMFLAEDSYVFANAYGNTVYPSSCML